MGIEKSEIKRATVQEVARLIEEKEELAKKEIFGFTGGLESLNRVLELINQYRFSLNDNNQQENQNVDIATKVILHCENIVNNLKMQSEINCAKKQGEIIAYNHALDICEKIFHAEGKKARFILAHAQSATETSKDFKQRPVGVRPENIFLNRKSSR